MNRIELIANIVLIIAGLVLGIVFAFTDNPAISIIMFSIALACILYQFLGGIGSQNSFQLGVIKFGGSAAVIAGFMYFMKTVLFNGETANCDINVSERDWVPLCLKTGQVIDPVVIGCSMDTIKFPATGSNYSQRIANLEYGISDFNNGRFNIFPEKFPEQVVGYIEIDKFNDKGLFNKVKVDEDETCIQDFELYPERDTQNSTNDLNEISLPFEIEVFNTSRFIIKPHWNAKRVLVKQTSYVVPGEPGSNEFYVVFLYQANSVHEIKTERYSKWLVKRMKYELEY